MCPILLCPGPAQWCLHPRNVLAASQAIFQPITQDLFGHSLPAKSQRKTQRVLETAKTIIFSRVHWTLRKAR